jgi:hypothetical protein
VWTATAIHAEALDCSGRRCGRWRSRRRQTDELPFDPTDPRTVLAGEGEFVAAAAPSDAAGLDLWLSPDGLPTRTSRTRAPVDGTPLGCQARMDQRQRGGRAILWVHAR